MNKKIRIAITGPESTGKTTLAQELSAALEAPWVPEFARFYVAHVGRPYERRDLCAIGRGQKLWEKWYERQSGEIVVLDTDWTVLQIWEEYRFAPEAEPEWRKGYGDPTLADLYVLCAPDFPWAPDLLREHPHEQAALFDLYAGLIRNLNTPFITAEGSPAARLEKVLEKIREL